jgi:hypothetical protein
MEQEKFKEHMNSIHIAIRKIKEFDRDQENISLKQSPVKVYFYRFKKVKSVLLFGDRFDTFSAQILLGRFGIQVILDTYERVFLFELDDGFDDKIIVILQELERNEILPDPHFFSDILPLRNMDVAEYLSCSGYGCDD